MRVLVPLDGTGFAAAILPDARRLAGPEGGLILVQDASILGTRWSTDVATIYERNKALGSATDYLESVARELQSVGVSVEVHALNLGDPAYAIDAAAQTFQADMVACATHGRGMFGRLLWGSVARRALLDSPVPILLRRAPEDGGPEAPSHPEQRRILLPLDGSRQAERAVPLAFSLAAEWQADLRLVQVTPDQWATPMEQLSVAAGPTPVAQEGPGTQELTYLQQIATEAVSHPHPPDVARPSMAASQPDDVSRPSPTPSGPDDVAQPSMAASDPDRNSPDVARPSMAASDPDHNSLDVARPSMAASRPRNLPTAPAVESIVLAGPVADRLATAVEQWSITDVVMTTHGRTGLPRVILGSVSDALVQRLTCPIIIVPSLS